MLVCDSATVVVVGGGGKKCWLVVSLTELTLAGLHRVEPDSCESNLGWTLLTP